MILETIVPRANRTTIVRMAAIYLACLVSSNLSLRRITVLAQPPDRPTREIPWRENIGGGRLTNPGRSRVLPPVDDAQIALLPKQSAAANERVPVADVDESWWKEDPKSSVGDPERNNQTRSVSPRGEIMLSTQIVAWVGSEAILAGDLLGRINEMLDSATVGDVPETELDRQRWLLMERMLPSAIESKLVYLDFIKRMEPAQLNAIRDSIYEQFDEKQLPRLVEQAKVNSPAALEQRLRSYGTSLDNVRRAFFEQVAAREMIRKKTSDEIEVTHDELLAYWKSHADQFAYKAQARWEHLMTRFDQFDSHQEAWRALAKMGNAVLRGAKFEVVARRDSQGYNADQGGQYDWTTEGSLVSKPLDHAIFNEPIGEMSEIFEDEDGYHIVRVIERKEAGYVPFVKAQVEIREQIKERRRDAKVNEYLEKLKRETYVWNYFDDKSQRDYDSKP